jgi:serine/threonine-protein kinase HipA
MPAQSRLLTVRLQQQVPLDPIELPLKEETFTTTRLKGVFGALRDAGPDYCN